MNVIDRFLQEDMLITKPSVFIYISKDCKDDVSNYGIRVSDGKVNAYLTRLPEDCDCYRQFLDTHYPVRLTLSKLRKIKDQIVQLVPKKIDFVTDKIDLKDDDQLEKIIKKYGHYLDVCYKDSIPLEELPHIEMFFSGGLVPGFVCKILSTDSK